MQRVVDRENDTIGWPRNAALCFSQDLMISSLSDFHLLFHLYMHQFEGEGLSHLCSSIMAHFGH